MSIRNIQQNNLPSKTLPGVTYLNGNWVRNPTWLPLSSITVSDQKFTGLYAIYPSANFAAINVTVSGGATYTIDWGDGSAPVNQTSNTIAYKQYDYADVDLANTDGPVTFTDSTDTVNRTNHGYVDGMNISFATITTTTGIVPTQIYYVVNSTTNSFQLASQPGGSPISLTNDGSGTILPYKQAVVTITLAAGTMTAINLYVKHNQAGLQDGYSTGWLDIAMAGNFTTIGIGNNNTVVRNNMIQQVNILKSNITSAVDLFRRCTSLQNVVNVNSSAVMANATTMFSDCTSLRKLSIFDTSNVTNMTSMFNNCYSLEDVPPLDTSKVTNMSGMFNTCYSLTTIPTFNTSNVTDMSLMFSNCNGLTSGPYLNTTKVTNMSSMFASCFALEEIPLYDTGNVTNTVSMFQFCYILPTVPLLNTSKVTNAQSMFNNCRSLNSIPLLDTGNCLNMSNFLAATGIISIPKLNTSNASNTRDIFASNFNLLDVPLVDTSNSRDIGSHCSQCITVQGVPVIDMRKSTAGSMFFSGVSTRFKFFKGFGAISSFDVSTNLFSNLVLNEIYTNLGRVGTGGGANNNVSFNVTNDTATKLSHGYSNGDSIQFSSVSPVTGITTYTAYYIRNATTDTFQLSNTLTGPIIDLTGSNGTGTIPGAAITVTGNYGTTTDDPTIATSKGWTVTGS